MKTKDIKKPTVISGKYYRVFSVLNFTCESKDTAKTDLKNVRILN